MYFKLWRLYVWVMDMRGHILIRDILQGWKIRAEINVKEVMKFFNR
jgi:hypothetical protein